MRGIGTDIIEISRICTLLERDRFMKRVYTAKEQAYLHTVGKKKAESAAGIFCAKEAVAKALGTGFSGRLSLQDIEITHTEEGAPCVTVARQKGVLLSLSISHCHTYATATAICWENNT